MTNMRMIFCELVWIMILMISFNDIPQCHDDHFTSSEFSTSFECFGFSGGSPRSYAQPSLRIGSEFCYLWGCSCRTLRISCQTHSHNWPDQRPAIAMSMRALSGECPLSLSISLLIRISAWRLRARWSRWHWRIGWQLPIPPEILRICCSSSGILVGSAGTTKDRHHAYLSIPNAHC